MGCITIPNFSERSVSVAPPAPSLERSWSPRLNLGRKLIVSKNLFINTRIQPITTQVKRAPYRQHSDEFKRAAVACTPVAGASISLIARELKISTHQLFSWRKRFGADTVVSVNAPSQLMAVAPVDVVD